MVQKLNLKYSLGSYKICSILETSYIQSKSMKIVARISGCACQF